LTATHGTLGKKAMTTWTRAPGFEKRFITEMPFNRAQGEAFCEEVNGRKERYVATEDNCQKFVDEFISNFIPESVVSLPLGVEAQKTIWGSFTSTSLNSLTNFGSGAMVKELVLKRVGTSGLEVYLRQAITEASAQGFGKISLLAESPLKEAIAETGKDLVLSSAGEITENMLNACRGAFNWFQLLQIPVEIITKKLLKKNGWDKTAAYGGSKAASLLTSAGVGAMAGGPVGLAASVAFWIGAEVAAYLVRKCLETIFGDGYISKFGESQTEALVLRIYDWFKCKIKNRTMSGIEWMQEYMKNAQGFKKIE